MEYTFSEQIFKNYLHENFHRNWFSKRVDNAKYKADNGTYDVEDYFNRYINQAYIEYRPPTPY